MDHNANWRIKYFRSRGQPSSGFNSLDVIELENRDPLSIESNFSRRSPYFIHVSPRENSLVEDDQNSVSEAPLPQESEFSADPPLPRRRQSSQSYEVIKAN